MQVCDLCKGSTHVKRVDLCALDDPMWSVFDCCMACRRRLLIVLLREVASIKSGMFSNVQGFERRVVEK